jgi:hypothetical protein
MIFFVEKIAFSFCLCIENRERMVAKLEKSGFLGQLVLKRVLFFGELKQLVAKHTALVKLVRKGSSSF